ncbi:hypothetical protein SLS64_003502 [Diaporthe eres]|uniref:Uncharacterized protein n=1 Tax=Diaporthe eres TaxID=83184 RepID=A0ABR1PD21_DIAER
MDSPGSKDEILQSLLQHTHDYNKRSPLYQGLRECRFDLEFPLLLNSRESPLACRETADQAQAVEAHFSDRIHDFFNALDAFEKLSNTTGNEILVRDVGLWPSIRITNQSFDRHPDCLHRDFHSRRLSLRDPGTLPQLQRVTKLRIFPRPDYGADLPFEGARPVSPQAPLELAARLPALRELDCPWMWERMPVAFSSRALRHYTRPWAGPWRDARREFGAAARDLSGRLPASLTAMRLWFWRPSAFCADEDQSAQMPDLVGAASGASSADPVSLGLRALGAQLERLDVRAFLTADLFRAPVVWPRMRWLAVEFQPWCPDGTWYFVGPRGENPHPDRGFEVTREEHYPPEGPDDDAEDREIDAEWAERDGNEVEDRATDAFRTEPRRDKVEPLLLGFASALHEIRTLEEAELFVWLAWQPSEQRLEEYMDAEEPFNQECAIFRWGVRYVPGTADSKGTVTWQVGAWRPDDEVIRAFESLGGSNGSVDMVWQPFEFLDMRPQEDLTAFT